MAQLEFMSNEVSGFAIWVEYNANNRRIQRVEWTIPAGIEIRARIWDSGQLVIDRTEGQGSDSENVPGNYRVVEEIDEVGDTNLVLPPNIIHTFQAQTIG